MLQNPSHCCCWLSDDGAKHARPACALPSFSQMSRTQKNKATEVRPGGAGGGSTRLPALLGAAPCARRGSRLAGTATPPADAAAQLADAAASPRQIACLPRPCRSRAVPLGPAEGQAGEAAHAAAGGELKGEAQLQHAPVSVLPLGGWLLNLEPLCSTGPWPLCAVSAMHTSSARALHSPPTPPQSILLCLPRHPAGRRRGRGV